MSPTNGSGKGTMVISCPWHRFDLPHPEGAPFCQHTGDLVVGHAMPLADLVTWVAIKTGEAAPMIAALYANFSEQPAVAVEDLETVTSELLEATVDGVEGEEPEGVPA